VRGIIAEQLGKDLGEVRRWLSDILTRRSSVMLHCLDDAAGAHTPSNLHGLSSYLIAVHCMLLQVTPEAKFVDLGADSLDTVRCGLQSCSTHVHDFIQLPAGTTLRNSPTCDSLCALIIAPCVLYRSRS
jgi:hypothetical protein